MLFGPKVTKGDRIRGHSSRERGGVCVCLSPSRRTICNMIQDTVPHTKPSTSLQTTIFVSSHGFSLGPLRREYHAEVTPGQANAPKPAR